MHQGLNGVPEEGDVAITHSSRLRATRKALRWWVISAIADLPPSERATVRIVKLDKKDKVK